MVPVCRGITVPMMSTGERLLAVGSRVLDGAQGDAVALDLACILLSHTVIWVASWATHRWRGWCVPLMSNGSGYV